MAVLNVNGKALNHNADPRTPLLWVLREQLGLTGTKYGCGIGECGACTVHVDDAPARACLTTVGSVAGKAITTIEGLAQHGLHPVQNAWVEGNVPQCGYCQPGQIMQAVSLLKSEKSPTDEAIDSVMSGNICRCGTYQRIRAAIKAAAKETVA